jgi:uncharacterized protein YbjT (DUF2867 family)
MKLLLLGATGLVGSSTLRLALADAAVTEIIAPTRRPLAPQSKLINPVDDKLSDFAGRLKSGDADAVICALGTTQTKAGSKEAFRYVDYELPLLYARVAHAAGIETYALVSAIGASTTSFSFYARTKGQVENDIQTIGFRSLTICRPSIIGGDRNESRFAEGIALGLSRILAPILPKKFHVNPAPVIAGALLTATLLAEPGKRWIYAEQMNS